jgi:hypothetical protein
MNSIVFFQTDENLYIYDFNLNLSPSNYEIVIGKANLCNINICN